MPRGKDDTTTESSFDQSTNSSSNPAVSRPLLAIERGDLSFHALRYVSDPLGMQIKGLDWLVASKTTAQTQSCKDVAEKRYINAIVRSIGRYEYLIQFSYARTPGRLRHILESPYLDSMPRRAESRKLVSPLPA